MVSSAPLTQTIPPPIFEPSFLLGQFDGRCFVTDFFISLIVLSLESVECVFTWFCLGYVILGIEPGPRMSCAGALLQSRNLPQPNLLFFHSYDRSITKTNFTRLNFIGLSMAYPEKHNISPFQDVGSPLESNSSKGSQS